MLEGALLFWNQCLTNKAGYLSYFYIHFLYTQLRDMVLELSSREIESIIATSGDLLASRDRKLYCTCLALLDNLGADVDKMVLDNINGNSYYKKILNDLLEPMLPPRSDEAFNLFVSEFLAICPDMTMSHFLKLQPNDYLYDSTSYVFAHIMEFYKRFQEHFSGTGVDFSEVIPDHYFECLTEIKKDILVSFGVANTGGSLVMAYGAKSAHEPDDSFKARSIPMKDPTMVKTMVDRLLDRRASYSEIFSEPTSS